MRERLKQTLMHGAGALNRIRGIGQLPKSVAGMSSAIDI
jgi:hypothetical protein